MAIVSIMARPTNNVGEIVPANSGCLAMRFHRRSDRAAFA